LDTPDTGNAAPGLNPPNPPQGADTPGAPEVDDAAGGVRAWLVQNGLTLAVLAALAGVAFFRFKVDPVVALVTILGLGLLIFIHELGHFLAAKWCDVHVETFSIGFGPPIPGCVFRRGETTYMLALIPLGGYVKMVGEGSDGEEGEDDPRSFKNKTVGQRMLIISAGVVMNLILGGACFVYAYMTQGVEEIPPVIGGVSPGSPAWEKGVRVGGVITQVGGKTAPAFDDIKGEVLRAADGAEIRLSVRPMTADGTPGPAEDFLIAPRRVADSPLPVFGVSSTPGKPVVGPVTSRNPLPYARGSAASQASPPVAPGDRIIATTDPDQPLDPEHYDFKKLKPLPVDPRWNDPQLLDVFAYRRRLQQLAGKKIVLLVRRTDKAGSVTEVPIEVPPAWNSTLGLRMRMGRVSAVRAKSPADGKVVPADRAKPEVKGDRIAAVEVRKDDGTVQRWVLSPSGKTQAGVVEKALDPVRLPYELLEWSAGAKDRTVKLTVLRAEGHDDSKRTEVELTWDDTWRYDEEPPFDPSSPMSIPCLGLAYKVESVVAGVEKGSPAEAAEIRENDVITDFQFSDYDASGREEPQRWMKLDEGGAADRWAYVAAVVVPRAEIKTFRLKRSNKPEVLTLTAVPCDGQDGRPLWPAADRGLWHEPDVRYRKAGSVGEALWMAGQLELRYAEQIYQSLKALVTGRVSLMNLHGPLSIARVTYAKASYSVNQFVVFLGILSINLAIINFLPIPVLDGGHMVFLLYEQLAGRAPSEAVKIGATLTGLAFIVGLMLFVFGLDIARLFF
jgi:regulator of sigma E protease